MNTPSAPLPARTFTVGIARPFDEAYAFVRQPENFPRWAAGLAHSLRRAGDAWIAESPAGQVTVRFSPPNEHGVLDHRVTLPSGETLTMPMRLIPSGEGCAVIFTLQRHPGMNDDVFARDGASVEGDLKALKALLEDRKASPVGAHSTDKDCKIDYIEWQSKDLARTKAFYAEVFGWSFKDYGPGYAAFSDGRLDGGFGAQEEEGAKSGALVVLYADDLEATLARVKAGGGVIVKEPFGFPGGRRFHFADPAGHELAVWSER